MTDIRTIAAQQTLTRAWRRVRRNAIGNGQADSAARYAARLEVGLQALAAALLSGRYRPGPLYRQSITKPDGGVRRLAIPPIRDRVAQTAAGLALDPLIDRRLSDASFAYRRGRSVAQAVGRVVTYRLWGAEWAVVGDIERFFDRIPHSRLLARLADHLACCRTVDLVGLWLDGFSTDRVGDGPGLGIAQGAPISPLLANLYLDPVDCALHHRRTRLVRYADDFVVLCPTAAGAEAAAGTMARLLAAEGLSLNPKKTRVTCFAEGFDFLGHRFRGDTVGRVGRVGAVGPRR